MKRDVRRPVRITPSRPLVNVAALVVVVLCTKPVVACPFCSKLGNSLVEEVGEADLVVFGRLSNARLAADGAGSTNLEILRVVRDHANLHETATVRVARYLPAAEKNAIDRLLFADATDRGIDPYRLMPVRDPEFVEYLKLAYAKMDAPPGARFAFLFHYLGHPDGEISTDAYKQFSKAPYRDVRRAAAAYETDRLRDWLADPETPSYRIGLFGLLLGIAGDESDARFIRSLLESSDRRPYDGLDGLFAGYCLLDPTGGVGYVLDVVTDPRSGFKLRYAALGALRFVLAQPADRDPKYIFDRLADALAIAELADLVVDEFRRHEQWRFTDRILELAAGDNAKREVVRRSVVRFALASPTPACKKFIDDLRRNDLELVRAEEQNLSFDRELQRQFREPAAERSNR